MSLWRCITFTVLACGPALAQAPALFARAERLATLAGIDPLLVELYACRGSESALRREITERVLEVSLEVDVVLAELDAENADAEDVRSYLRDRRQSALGILSAASLALGSGLGIVVNATQLSRASAKPGDWVGVASGIGTTTMSIVAGKILRTNRASPALLPDTAPNMLGGFLEGGHEAPAGYPEIVWLYLTSLPNAPGAQTWRQELLAAWTRLGRLPKGNSAKDRRRYERLVAPFSVQRTFSVPDLSRRAAMLHDLRARVALMKFDEVELMRTLRQAPRCDSAPELGEPRCSAVEKPAQAGMPVPLNRMFTSGTKE